MTKLEIYNWKKVKNFFANKFHKKDLDLLVRDVLRDYSFHVNIVFLDKNSIKKLNNTFRNINKPTDVLSFINSPQDNECYLDCYDSSKEQVSSLKNKESSINRLPNKLKKTVIEGEIYICPEICVQNADLFEKSFVEINTKDSALNYYQIEIIRVIVHGLLHLRGFDHVNNFTKDSTEEMYLIQENILKKCIMGLE